MLAQAGSALTSRLSRSISAPTLPLSSGCVNAASATSLRISSITSNAFISSPCWPRSEILHPAHSLRVISLVVYCRYMHRIGKHGTQPSHESCVHVLRWLFLWPSVSPDLTRVATTQCAECPGRGWRHLDCLPTVRSG